MEISVLIVLSSVPNLPADNILHSVVFFGMALVMLSLAFVMYFRMSVEKDFQKISRKEPIDYWGKVGKRVD
jgi:hypothetical protein